MINKDKFNLHTINVIFLLFPLSIIFGNFYTNLNIVLLIIVAFFSYYKKIIKFKLIFVDKIIIIFFFYTLITLIINFAESYLTGTIFPDIIIYKTLLYFRYLILYLILRALIAQKILNLEWFSLMCAFCAAFICFDIFFQFIFGKDIFGIDPGLHSFKFERGDFFLGKISNSYRHYSGVFGGELIAGGYLQKFALFTFFLPFIVNKKKFYKIFIQFIFFIVFMFGIILSGNRMPFFLFILSFFTILFLDRHSRKYFYMAAAITTLILTLNFNLNPVFNYNVKTIVSKVNLLTSTFFLRDMSKEPLSVWRKPYVTEFYCFKDSWKQNPIFGGGIRYYRTFSGGCNTHPHNYYFEILTDLGLVGLGIILIFIFTLLKETFIKKLTTFKPKISNLNSKFMPFFLIFFFEFFPIRTSGSFFTTGNASIIFVILAALVSLIPKKKNYNY